MGDGLVVAERDALFGDPREICCLVSIFMLLAAACLERDTKFADCPLKIGRTARGSSEEVERMGILTISCC